METEAYESVPNSDRSNEGQREKGKILKYVNFGILAVLLFLSVSFVFRVILESFGIFKGQEIRTDTGEETSLLVFLMDGMIAILVFLTIGLAVSAIFEMRRSLHTFKEQENPRQTEGKTPQITAENNFMSQLFEIALGFFLIFLFLRENMEIFTGREKILSTGEKTPPHLHFLMFVLLAIFLCLIKNAVFLFKIRGKSKSLKEQENLHQTEQKTPPLKNFKFVAYVFFTTLTFLSFFAVILFCEIRDLKVFERKEKVSQTKDKTFSLVIFACATSGLIAVLLFLLYCLIFLACKNRRSSDTLVAKGNSHQTEHKIIFLGNFKVLVFELFLVILSLSFFSIFVFFEMREITEMFEGKEIARQTEGNISHFKKKCLVLGRLAVLPLVKVCLLFIFWEMRENSENFMEEEKPHEIEGKTTPLKHFWSVVFGILPVIFFLSISSVLMYHEMQVNLDFLDRIDYLIPTYGYENTSPGVFFKFVEYVLMMVSYSLYHGLLIVFWEKRFYSMVTQENARHTEGKSLPVKVKFGHFAVFLFLSISLVFFEVQRYMEMFEGQENMP